MEIGLEFFQNRYIGNKCITLFYNILCYMIAQLRQMSYGTRCLLRPVQSHGRIVSYQWNKSASGSSLKGHMYSSHLNTPFVRSKLPLTPEEAPCRVIITSPFATDSKAYQLAKMASIKDDYIIESEKIHEVLQFFKHVENRMMAGVELDIETLYQLDSLETSPDGRVISPAMFLHCDSPETETTSSCSDSSVKKSIDTEDPTDGTGGPSLLRTNEEMETAIFISATVTIGADKDDANKRVAEMLCGEDASEKQTQPKTYAVRPMQEFASDSSLDYLESHYPELFPFGRGGFGEIRKKRLSRAAILKRLLNLSERQFQQSDFVLPCYDLVTKLSMKQSAFIRAKLPSYQIGSDGIRLAKAEAFGKVSLEDMKLVGEYKKACALAATKGIY